MALADKIDLPVITLIDTPGAFPGAGAEERGQGGAIARSMQTMLRLRVPSVAVVIGEGSSGGALALGVTDRVMMLENSTYSVISPEGGAAILWRDAARARDAAARLPADRGQLLPLGHRRRGGARALRRRPPRPRRGGPPAGRLHRARPARAAGPPPADRKRLRRDRYRRIGAYREVAAGDPDGHGGRAARPAPRTGRPAESRPRRPPRRRPPARGRSRGCRRPPGPRRAARPGRRARPPTRPRRSTRSSLMPSDPVARAPTMPAEIATLPPWQMIPIGQPARVHRAHQVAGSPGRGASCRARSRRGSPGRRASPASTSPAVVSARTVRPFLPGCGSVSEPTETPSPPPRAAASP